MNCAKSFCLLLLIGWGARDVGYVALDVSKVKIWIVIHLCDLENGKLTNDILPNEFFVNYLYSQFVPVKMASW